MRVTEIGECRKKHNAIYIDDKYFGDIDHEVILLSKLQKGSEIDEKVLRALVQKSELKKAREKALYLLERRSYTKSAFIERLKQNFNQEIAGKVADKMEQLGFLNDEDFAITYAQELLYKKCFSKYRTLVELTKKGIKKSIAENAIALFDIDERSQIEILVKKKFPDVQSDEKIKKRAVMFLQRYGYKLSDVLSVVRE